jgi:hypothetical protein
MTFAEETNIENAVKQSSSRMTKMVPNAAASMTQASQLLAPPITGRAKSNHANVKTTSDKYDKESTRGNSRIDIPIQVCEGECRSRPSISSKCSLSSRLSIASLCARSPPDSLVCQTAMAMATMIAMPMMKAKSMMRMTMTADLLVTMMMMSNALVVMMTALTAVAAVAMDQPAPAMPMMKAKPMMMMMMAMRMMAMAVCPTMAAYMILRATMATMMMN